MSRSCIPPWTDMCFSKWSHLLTTWITLGFICSWIRYVLPSWKHRFSTCVTLDFLLMSTKCILEMETSAQGFGSLSKNSGKTNGKSTFLFLVTTCIAELESLILNMSYSWLYVLMTTRCTAVFLTLTIRSPISYYPWIQNTTAVYSWKGIVNYVSSMCV